MMENRPNIVLLTIDCLRADHLGCMGYERQTTPFIDKLAKDGVLFKSAYANGPITHEAFKSIFCSVYPTQIKGLGLPPDKPPTLAELLKSRGYATAGFNVNARLSSSFGYNRGFDFFYDIDVWKESLSDRTNIETKRLLRDLVKNRWHRIFTRIFKERTLCLWRDFEFLHRQLFADELTGKALKWVKKQNGPFFVWIHFMDIHHPYLVRNRSPKIKRNALRYVRGGKSTKDELEELINLYDDQIPHVGASIKKFSDEVFELNSLGTIFIITADHGEEFMEHGRFHHATPYQEMIHVPLIIVGNGLPQGLEINTPVSHIDLLPTVMDMIGQEVGWWAEGQSLLPCIREKATEERLVFINCAHGSRRAEKRKEFRAILDNEKKLIFREKDNSWEFYDLVLDPFERNNLFNEGDAVQQKMRKKMEDVNYSVKSKASYMSKEAEVSKHVIDQLKALGYLD